MTKNYPRTYLVSAATTTAVTVVPSSFAFATAALHPHCRYVNPEFGACRVTDLQIAAADEAADYLATLHRDGQLDLHAHTPLAEFVTAWFGGWQRDGMDDADDQQAAWKDEQ